jgi:hypothetical protein
MAAASFSTVLVVAADESTVSPSPSIGPDAQLAADSLHGWISLQALSASKQNNSLALIGSLPCTGWHTFSASNLAYATRVPGPGASSC